MVEYQLSHRSVHKVRFHHSFLEHSRVANKPEEERSFDIFYQMLAGLSTEDKNDLEMSNLQAQDFKYLRIRHGQTKKKSEKDFELFKDWRKSIDEIGINVGDIMKVFSAILLLGNIELDRADAGGTEVESVSKLLSIKKEVLMRGLTTRTHKIRGEILTRNVDKKIFLSSKNSLSTSLYARTVNIILKKINCINQSKNLKSQEILKPASFFILDSFSLQRSHCGLETLGMNLCTEKLQVCVVFGIIGMVCGSVELYSVCGW